LRSWCTRWCGCGVNGPVARTVAPVPNTRVQRTRSSASPPHSPLTRSPLGDLVVEGQSIGRFSRRRRRYGEAASRAFELFVAAMSWRQDQRRNRHRGIGFVARKLRSPNMRVQRTRSSPSALRSPLTRGPLGRPK
jgi:hypothetical protein